MARWRRRPPSDRPWRCSSHRWPVVPPVSSLSTSSGPNPLMPAHLLHEVSHPQWAVAGNDANAALSQILPSLLFYRDSLFPITATPSFPIPQSHFSSSGASSFPRNSNYRV